MPYNGTGTFNRLFSWISDRSNGILINASRMDQEMNGFATGLSDCVTRDGQSIPTANLPMGGFVHTNVGNATASNQYAALGQVQSQSFIWCGTSGGTANAQTLTPTPTISAYAAGQKFSFLPVATNTSGTVTIANSGLTARNVKKSIGGALVILAIGDLQIGVPAEVVDDGTEYVLTNPQTYCHGADITSATTVVLDTTTGDLVDITGTVTITAITLAEGREVTARFTGILTLTNGASLVLPGGANITTAAGDYAVFRGYASGVVRCVNYAKASGLPIINPSVTTVVSVKTQSFPSSGTYTPSTGMLECFVRMVGGGGGGGGANGSSGAPGGGGGEYAEGIFTAATVGASQIVTIGGGGSGGTASPGAGGNGGTTSLGSLLTAAGGTGGPASTGVSQVGGAGGTGGTGTGIHIPGQPGGPLISATISFSGGASLLGFGGAATISSTPNAGQNYGGGGSGPTGSVHAGAAGAGGVVIITEYCSQ